MRVPRSAAGLLVGLILFGGCTSTEPSASPDGVGPSAPPLVVIPPGVVSSQSAQQVAQKMLAEIAANERTLGRVLAPAHIIRIQLLQPGETYLMTHLDGTNPGGSGMSPDGGPGWMVEATGTFFHKDRQTGQIDAQGTHGFHLWDDVGSESFGFIPCWTVGPAPPAELEGRCP